MIFKSMVSSFLTMLIILCAPVLAGAQTQGMEGPSVPQRSRENYWLMVNEFADGAVNFAYAKHFVQVHEGFLTDRQCQQYARVTVDYTQQLSTARQAGVSARSKFWSDVRAYSISMIGASGVPIPGRRGSKYSMTTGSTAKDREMRRIVLHEIDETRSQFIPGYSLSVLKPDCRPTAQELTAKVER